LAETIKDDISIISAGSSARSAIVKATKSIRKFTKGPEQSKKPASVNTVQRSARKPTAKKPPAAKKEEKKEVAPAAPMPEVVPRDVYADDNDGKKDTCCFCFEVA